MEGLMAKKPEEPPRKVNHKGNVKFWNPLLSQEAYQIKKREEILKRGKSSHYVKGAKEATCKLMSKFHKLLLLLFNWSGFWKAKIIIWHLDAKPKRYHGMFLYQLCTVDYEYRTP
jgi:hypothetical protein